MILSLLSPVSLTASLSLSLHHPLPRLSDSLLHSGDGWEPNLQLEQLLDRELRALGSSMPANQLCFLCSAFGLETPQAISICPAEMVPAELKNVDGLSCSLSVSQRLSASLLLSCSKELKISRSILMLILRFSLLLSRPQ